MSGEETMEQIGFLSIPAHTPQAQALFDEDEAELGYVMNVSRLWAYQPATMAGLFELMRQSLAEADLSSRQRGILVAAAASSRQDSCCSLAWGSKLAHAASPAIAAAVIRGDDTALAGNEQVMASWARKVVRDPNATTSTDIQALRDAGFADAQIFAMTTFVALRLAFSTINDALGATPDAELHRSSPPEVVAAVAFGRPADGTT
jgi:alkylhydroperoxidase family enzyme